MENMTLSSGTSHKLHMIDRKRCNMTGITEVISFNENDVILDTIQGTLHMKGTELHVKSLNLEKGEIELEGMVGSFAYAEDHAMRQKGEGFLARLFR